MMLIGRSSRRENLLGAIACRFHCDAAFYQREIRELICWFHFLTSGEFDEAA
jgi:hypothetical protein